MKIFISFIVVFTLGFFVGGRWKAFVVRKTMERAHSAEAKLDAVVEKLHKLF